VIHARYGGNPDAPQLWPASGLLTPDARRRAAILGRAMQLGYRISGGVPELLAGARLRIGEDSVRLAVSKAARAPDSEVVANRLQRLASAAGIARTELVEVAHDDVTEDAR
jgi:exopolyphosphatase/guanosine-5'-triphosphate,3'-diphosphate pyrophosphatase